MLDPVLHSQDVDWVFDIPVVSKGNENKIYEYHVNDEKYWYACIEYEFNLFHNTLIDKCNDEINDFDDDKWVLFSFKRFAKAHFEIESQENSLEEGEYPIHTKWDRENSHHIAVFMFQCDNWHNSLE